MGQHGSSSRIRNRKPMAGPTTPYGYYQAGDATPQYIVIEGLHLRNATPAYNYTPPAGGAAVAWIAGASCVNLRTSFQTVVVGNDMENCSNGTFSDFNAAHAWLGGNNWTLWEGNHIHSSGISGSASYHQLYLQGWGQVAQFNRIDNYTVRCDGSQFQVPQHL